MSQRVKEEVPTLEALKREADHLLGDLRREQERSAKIRRASEEAKTDLEKANQETQRLHSGQQLISRKVEELRLIMSDTERRESSRKLWIGDFSIAYASDEKKNNIRWAENVVMTSIQPICSAASKQVKQAVKPSIVKTQTHTRHPPMACAVLLEFAQASHAMAFRNALASGPRSFKVEHGIQGLKQEVLKIADYKGSLELEKDVPVMAAVMAYILHYIDRHRKPVECIAYEPSEDDMEEGHKDFNEKFEVDMDRHCIFHKGNSKKQFRVTFEHQTNTWLATCHVGLNFKEAVALFFEKGMEKVRGKNKLTLHFQKELLRELENTASKSSTKTGHQIEEYADETQYAIGHGLQEQGQSALMHWSQIKIKDGSRRVSGIHISDFPYVIEFRNLPH